MLDIVLHGLLVPVVAVHLLAVNVAAAGPFVGLWLQWRERRGDEHSLVYGEAGRMLSRFAMRSLAVALVLGMAALGILWLTDRGPFFDAFSAVPVRRYVFGGLELAFYFACVGWHLACWRQEAPRWYSKFGWWLLPLLAGTNLMYHFPTLFAVIAVVSTRPELANPQIDFLATLAEPEALARTLHHLLSSFAVAGVALTGMRSRLEANTGDSLGAARLSAYGARIALAPSSLQLAAGLVLLLSLPAESRRALMGGDALTAGLFVTSLVATLVLLHLLAAASLAAADRKSAWRAAVALAIVVILMTAVRQRARDGVFREIKKRQGAAI